MKTIDRRMLAEHLFSPSTQPALTELDHLVNELSSFAFHIALGLAAGAAAAAVMRRRHLRWTWSLSALALALQARPLLADWFYPLIFGATYAAARGRRRHREDLAAGGDMAEIARARRGPFLVARGAAIGLCERLGVRPQARPLVGDRMLIGRDERCRFVSVPFGLNGGKHTLIVGATGSGKTVTETWMACRAVEAGQAAIVVDPKGDRRMRDQLAASARMCGRAFLEWTPAGPNVYDPYGHGSASEIADKALAVERFTEPHYQRQAQRYIGYAVRTLRGAGSAVSLSTLVAALDPQRLEELAHALPVDQATAALDYLSSLSARQRSELGGVRDRLAILAESDLAAWLDAPGDGGSRCGHATAGSGPAAFDLLSAIRNRAVVYFALQADSRPLLAQMLGSAIVVDLRSAMSALQHSPVATVVVIDEFAAIATEQVAHLFGRARSAGVTLVLGTQELSDLRVDGRAQLREQVLGNLSSLVAHRQVVSESAELISRLAGSRGSWRSSQTSSGGWTRTRTAVPLISAQAIRGLPVGRAAVLDLAAGGAARIAHVFSSVA